MEMTRETLELIQDTACRSTAAQVSRIDGDPDRVLISQNGEREFINLPAKHRDHRLFDIESLVEMAGRNPNCVLWHSEKEIVLVMDDETRRDRATFGLKLSVAYAGLMSLGAGKQFDQQNLIRFLKVTLAGSAPDDLLPKLRTIKFARREDGESTFDQSKASMGRKVESSITGTSVLPEEFLVETNVYVNAMADFKVRLRVALDADHETQTFRLSVIGDGLDESMLEAQTQLSNVLTEQVSNFDEGEPRRVLFGSP